MNPRFCDDKSLLIAYLYGECDAAERDRMERHLAACETCAAEVDELRGVRTTLAEWSAPEQALGFRMVREQADAPAATPAAPAGIVTMGPARWWNRMPARIPAWAQAAAAVLVLALGAGIANLDVTVGGVTIRTGWQKTTTDDGRAVRSEAAKLRQELAAMERRIREEMPQVVKTEVAAAAPARPVLVTTPAAAARPASEDTGATMRRVQTLLDERDSRLQRLFDQQLAERMLRFTHDINSQRVADQRRVLQGLNQIDVRTTQIGLQQNQLQNYMLRNVSVREIK